MNFRGIRTQQGTDALLPPPPTLERSKRSSHICTYSHFIISWYNPSGQGWNPHWVKKGGGTKPSDTVKKHFFYLQFVFTVILLCFFKKPHKLISLLKHPTYTLWSALQVKICSKLYNGQFLSLQSKHFV